MTPRKELESMKELTVIEAARQLGISLDALYRLIYADKLQARKEGKKWLIDSNAVEERIKKRGGNVVK
jgi:excisionase family DNA binding protein